MDNAAHVDYSLVFQAGLSIQDVLRQKLIEAYENAYLETPEAETVNRILRVRYTRRLSKGARHTFAGVTLLLDALDDEQAAEVVNNFTDGLAEAQDEGIVHVVKLHDPVLYRENAQYAAEIFEIEMKLREAFTFIFADTIGDDFYKLISENINFMGDAPQESQMQARRENEFFYLTFKQYRDLNKKKQIKNAEQILNLIGQASDFRSLQELLSKTPISKEEYRDFLARLDDVLDSIENVRNCVAHNRTIAKKDKENYPRARERLIRLVDEFLASMTR